ncbi:MAG: PP2C family serine/threonine-protein phosphatase, partial [Gemmatimonadota bacterium]
AGGRWRIGHVGDSRAYLLRDGELRQLTVDHSWVGLQVARGELTKEEARRHPMSSALERALGTSPEVEVDVEGGEARPGDLFLLCSDGLNAMLPDAEIESLLLEEGELPAGEEPAGDGELEAATDRLVDAAVRAGGDDNVTVVLVAVGS